MKTIIAEKPSVAREIARIVGATKREEGYFEGGGYAVTWAFGHLVQLAMPDGYGIRGFVRDNLPVIPDTFTLVPRQVKTEKGYKPDSGVVTQIKTVARLFKESEQIIVATDAGREGELIFRYLYHYTGCTTPFVRLWISSLTDKAIREGLRNLEAGGKYDNLYLAAKARSESDWLVGINGTQALSIAAGHGTYSVGRVQTPTLAMVCARYWENRRFSPEAFWQLHIATDGCDEGTVKFSSSEKWKEKEPATELYNKVKSAGTATVTKAERKEKTEETPLLYDLTTLQKEANAKHGFTAEQTLEIAQKLYEKKLITYPRTGSRYIPEDVFAEIPKLLAFIGALPEWKGKVQPKAVPTRRSVDGSKVTDHHALLVTGEKPLFLSKEDSTVYQMVAGRMIEAFSEKCVKDTATVTAECAGVEFTVKGSVIRQAGWRAVYGGDGDTDEAVLPGEEKKKGLRARLRERLLALPLPVRALTALPLWLLGWALNTTASALWSGLLSPIGGAVLGCAGTAAVTAAAAGLTAKAVFPDMPMKRFFSKKTLLRLVVGCLVFGIATALLELFVPEFEALRRLIGATALLIVLLWVTLPALRRERLHRERLEKAAAAEEKAPESMDAFRRRTRELADSAK